jgi:hypothetical protein
MRFENYGGIRWQGRRGLRDLQDLKARQAREANAGRKDSQAQEG